MYNYRKTLGGRSMKVSILGATGYAGEELLRLLAGHPQAEITHITSESQTGTEIVTIYPHLGKYYGQKLESMASVEAIAKDSDVVFVALPHGHAQKIGKVITQMGAKMIDLGADYRFKDIAVYEKWYKVKHEHAEASAVYGLPELNRDEIKKASIIGNPGCFTTASILALAPLVKAKLIALDTIIIDAKTGVSGAGRGFSMNAHFSESFENVKAYNVAGHRHTPEIEEVLSQLGQEKIILSFTPHLIPMARGILSTCYAKLKAGVTADMVTAVFKKMYGDEYFIRLLGLGGYPATKQTRGSNFCNLGWHVDVRTGRVIVLSAIDNLVKGAAGQAVQNMNILFGLEETVGLMQAPLYP